MSENYKQAPRLIHSGKKFVNPNDRFWQLPQVLMSNIFNELNGKSGNQIKLMCLLIGTAGDCNFRVSTKWVLEQTGMDETGYKRARKELIERGWLIHENGTLTVDFDRIWAEGMKLHCDETGEVYTGASVASGPEVVASGRTSVASSQKWEASCF